MANGLARLAERDKEVLRLLGQGHDAKSAAAALGLSVHTVNDRLRDARGKLGVTSSREAARLLRDAERDTQETQVEKFGVGERPGPTVEHGVPGRSRRAFLVPFLAGGLFMSLVALLFVALLPSGSEAPRVVATTPAAGETIAPGPFTLSVTYDRPMAERSFSFVQVSTESYPQCARTPFQSRDRRTFKLRCVARSGGRYEVWFNRGRFANFRSADGVPAKPHRLHFSAR